MRLCNHEEADTRLLVHVQHAVESGAKAVMISAVDNDVIVITHLGTYCPQRSLSLTISTDLYESG